MLVVVGAAVGAGAAQAQASFGPYDGMTGYLQIRTGAGAYVVAVHGSRETTVESVRVGWAARAAQLCQADGAGDFVQLRYTGEPVLLGEVYAAQSVEPRPQMVKGPVYVPIFIPSGGPRVAELNAPSKIAAVRCVAEPQRVKDPQRLVRAADALERATAAGVSVK